MTFPNNFCIAPFIQHTTHPSGSHSPCPYLGGTVWKNRETSIIKQWTSQGIEELRQEFLENKKPDVCFRCWNEEDNGKKSLRKRLLDPMTFTSDYKSINDDQFKEGLVECIENKDYVSGPKILTIKNGNICNAKCRSCAPIDSSRWIEDAKKLNSVLGKSFYHINGEISNWSDEQLDEIFNLSKNINRLELFGGEPLYNKSVITLLDRIIESGDSKHITLYINTNGSVNIIDKVPNLKYFKCVEIGVSLDGYDDKFAYIRHGLDFDTVILNIKKWQMYFLKNNVPFWIDSISTVSVLNVYYLPELKERVMKVLPLTPFWNLLIEPEHLSIRNMPEHVKKVVIDKLKNDKDFDELISVMNREGNAEHWRNFLDITYGLDEIRKENFETTFPEFFQVITGSDK